MEKKKFDSFLKGSTDSKWWDFNQNTTDIIAPHTSIFFIFD